MTRGWHATTNHQAPQDNRVSADTSICSHCNGGGRMNSIGNSSYIHLPAPPYFISAEKQPAAAGAPDTSNPLIPTKSTALSKQLDAYFKRQEETRQAIAKLNVMTQDAAQMKKASAAERIKRIKEQLKMLMSMGMIGDPKANARQIAQLAKELAAAASEYASAGGAAQQNSSAAHTATASTENNSAAPASNSAGNATAEVAAVATEVLAAGTSTNASPATAPAQLSLTADSQQGAPQTRTALLNKIGELHPKSAASEADRDFAREVRNLAAQLKALAKQQEARLHLAGDHTADSEIAKIGQAINEIEQVVASISAPSAEAGSAINIFA